MCASWEYVNTEMQLWNDNSFDNFMDLAENLQENQI